MEIVIFVVFWFLTFWFFGGMYVRLGHIRTLLTGIFALLKYQQEQNKISIP